MRRNVFILLLLTLPFLAAAQMSKTYMPYVRAGLNLLPPTLEDLEYLGLSEDEARKNILIFGGGLQIKTDMYGTGLGLDVGGGSLFVNRIIHDQGVGTSYHVDSEADIYILLFAERELGPSSFYQVGLGPHIIPWYYTYYYESDNYTDVYDEYGGVTIKAGLSGAVGTELPFGPGAGFYCMARMDMIFQYGILLPVTVVAGLRFGN